ncbi:MAG TPA: hypothetical protein PKL57_16050, partial [Candidatus Wallbacteria bacterium]|nr:hypothetical protein [Candidatus Wallbacteria bacterium]
MDNISKPSIIEDILNAISETASESGTSDRDKNFDRPCGHFNSLHLKNSDFHNFHKLLIEGTYNEKYRLSIEKLRPYFSGAGINIKIPLKLKYFLVKLFRMNDLLYSHGLREEFMCGAADEKYKIHDFHISLWYLLCRAKIREIAAFKDYFSDFSKKTGAVKILIEESRKSFESFFLKSKNLIALQKLKIHYNDISESSSGQKRRDAEYKYYVVSEYLSSFGLRWALFNEDCDESVLIYDALKCRVNSICETQLKNKKIISMPGSRESEILEKAACCFKLSDYAAFKNYFSDTDKIKSVFESVLETMAGKVFQKYKSGVSFELFEKSLNSTVNRIISRYIDWCCSEMNAAEYSVDEKPFPDMILHCFKDAGPRAAEMLDYEICRWIEESVINLQIADKNIAVVNRFIIFNDGSNFGERIISDEQLAELASKYHSLHIVFSCGIDSGGKKVRELCRYITPTHDCANGRAIVHSDFAPSEISYAKGV